MIQTASKSCGREGERMPDAGSRVVLRGATYVVKSRTGDTLECHALGSPLSTTCEDPQTQLGAWFACV
jgi:hypothetical protein